MTTDTRPKVIRNRVDPRETARQAHCDECGGERDRESLHNGVCVRCRIAHHERAEAMKAATPSVELDILLYSRRAR